MELIRLERRHVTAAADSLAEAFFEDALVRRICPDEAFRRWAVTPVFRFSAGMAVKAGEAWATSPQMEGVALWLYSEKMICPPWRWLALGGYNIRFHLTAQGYRELTRVSDRIDRARDTVAPGRFLYLSCLGVRQEYRRQGLARALVEDRVKNAVKEGLPTVVETNTPGALAFYQSIGFRVKTTFQVADMEYYVLIYE